MIEILMVVAIAGILYVMMGPRVAETRAKASLRAARQELVSAFASARAAALQKGKTSTLTLTSGTATVTVLSGLNGTSTTVFGPIKFNGDLNTTVTALGGAPTSISYDARGLVTPAPAANDVRKYRLVSGIYADTLCISAAGIILPRGCQL